MGYRKSFNTERVQRRVDRIYTVLQNAINPMSMEELAAYTGYERCVIHRTIKHRLLKGKVLSGNNGKKTKYYLKDKESNYTKRNIFNISETTMCILKEIDKHPLGAHCSDIRPKFPDIKKEHYFCTIRNCYVRGFLSRTGKYMQYKYSLTAKGHAVVFNEKLPEVSPKEYQIDVLRLFYSLTTQRINGYYRRLTC